MRWQLELADTRESETQPASAEKIFVVDHADFLASTGASSQVHAAAMNRADASQMCNTGVQRV